VFAEAEAGYGSFDTKRVNGLLDASGDIGNAGASVSWLKSSGFPTRQNSNLDSGYDNLTATAHAGTTLGSVDIGARIYQTRGTADYLNSPTAFVNQDYTDRLMSLDAAAQATEMWHTRAVLSHMDNTIDQNQPVSFPAGEMDYLETHRNTIDWQNDLKLTDTQQLTAGATFARENAHALSFGTFFHRDAHSLLLAAGYTDYSTFGGHVTWNAEYGYNITPDTKLVGAYGTAFHAPTATDLYGFGGNPNLDPEKSRSIEISLRQRISVSQSLAISAFENDIDDLITFDSVAFIVRNIARAQIRGLEAHYEYVGQDWRAHVEATIQDPRDRDTDQQLLRRAKKTLLAGYAQSFGDLKVGADAVWSGPRLDSRFPGTVELGSYVLANLNARYAITDQLSMLVQLDNVLNTNYQVASGYNTAGRSGSIAVRWNLH
jgi:vitamin B12 transporter